MNNAPFTPGATVTRTVTTSTQAVALGRNGVPQTVMVTSDSASSGIMFIKFGTGSVTAAVTDFPIRPGERVCLSIGADITHVAAIMASGTGTLYFTTGDGGSGQ